MHPKNLLKRAKMEKLSSPCLVLATISMCPPCAGHYLGVKQQLARNMLVITGMRCVRKVVAIVAASVHVSYERCPRSSYYRK
jgi:hypothetical protein